MKLHFEIIEGDHKGRLAWHYLWLTEAAKRQTVRNLGKLGIASKAQLEGPIPRWIRCLITLVVCKSDLGTEYNRVRTFESIGIDKPEADPFVGDADQEGEPIINVLPWDFRILGPTTETRRLVDAAAAFRGYATLDQRADVWPRSVLIGLHLRLGLQPAARRNRLLPGPNGRLLVGLVMV